MLTKFLDDYKKNMNGQNPQVAEQYQRIYKYWQFIEKTLRQQTLAMKYQALIANCLITNPVSVKMALEGENVESTVQLASASYASVNDNEVKVSDSDLKQKYEEKKELFKQANESRDIKYVDFQVLPSQADRKALMASMKQAAADLEAGVAPAEVVRKNQSSVGFTGLAISRNAMPRDIAAKVDSMTVGQTSAPFETMMDNTLNVVKLISKVQLPDRSPTLFSFVRFRWVAQRLTRPTTVPTASSRRFRVVLISLPSPRPMVRLEKSSGLPPVCMNTPVPSMQIPRTISKPSLPLPQAN